MKQWLFYFAIDFLFYYIILACIIIDFRSFPNYKTKKQQTLPSKKGSCLLQKLHIIFYSSKVLPLLLFPQHMLLPIPVRDVNSMAVKEFVLFLVVEINKARFFFVCL